MLRFLKDKIVDNFIKRGGGNLTKVFNLILFEF